MSIVQLVVDALNLIIGCLSFPYEAIVQQVRDNTSCMALLADVVHPLPLPLAGQ